LNRNQYSSYIFWASWVVAHAGRGVLYHILFQYTVLAGHKMLVLGSEQIKLIDNRKVFTSALRTRYSEGPY
jgi:hypothetical protein